MAVLKKIWRLGGKYGQRKEGVHMKKLQVRLNPYLEFINSILLTGKYNEITAPVVGYGLMNEEENEYTTAVRAHFEPHTAHPVYAFVEEMIPQGFTFARPVELALSLGEGDDFSMQYRVSDFCTECCGGMPKIEELLRLLKAFDRKVEYCSFYNREKGFYESYLEKARVVAEAHPYVELLEREYGKEQGPYQLVITSLMKGNFGIVFEEERTRKSHIYAVLSTEGFSISPNILFHEFSHPFINPLTEQYAEEVAKYQDAYERLKPYKLPGFGSGYGDWQECVNEHLVRAMVIHLMRRCKLYKEAEEQLGYDLELGYKYIPLLLESYEYYDRNREQYPDFESYYTKVLEVFLEEFT